MRKKMIKQFCSPQEYMKLLQLRESVENEGRSLFYNSLPKEIQICPVQFLCISLRELLDKIQEKDRLYLVTNFNSNEKEYWIVPKDTIISSEVHEKFLMTLVTLELLDYLCIPITTIA